MVWHESFPTHKDGCGKRGRSLKISAKKAVFLVSSEKKEISPLIAPLEKSLEKATNASPRKNPSDAPAHKLVKLHHFCKNCVVLHHLAALFNNTDAVSKP